MTEKDFSEIRPEQCGKCGGNLDWFFDPEQDAGKCEDCGEIWDVCIDENEIW